MRTADEIEYRKHWTELPGVREYAEEFAVELGKYQASEFDTLLAKGQERLVVKAVNEGGYNCTMIDLPDLLKYVKEHLPEIWNQFQ